MYKSVAKTTDLYYYQQVTINIQIMSEANSKFDEGFSEPESSMFSPGLPGDKIKGTLISVKPLPDGKFGPTTLYELKGIAGTYHRIVDSKIVNVPEEEIARKESKGFVVLKKETSIVNGDVYALFEKKVFADSIKKAKVGQQVIIEYIEDRKSLKGQEYKYIVCKLGPMDPELTPKEVNMDDVAF